MLDVMRMMAAADVAAVEKLQLQKVLEECLQMPLLLLTILNAA